MWNRISGKSDEGIVSPSKSSTRRSHGKEIGAARKQSGAIISTDSKKLSSRRSDEPSRGLNPTSTSFSSTSQTTYQGVAAPSVAYAPASGNGDYVPPDLVRNASLVDNMVKSRSSQDNIDEFRDDIGSRDGRKSEKRRERSSSRDRNKNWEDKVERRERNGSDAKVDRRDRKDKRRKDSGSSKYGSGVRRQEGTSRGPEEFGSQVESNSFVQFPGQNDASIPGPVPIPQHHEPMSSHVQDQFPGHFTPDSSLPYRPPVLAAEAGPGLAAEYYGDTGESVAHQPGFRKHSPSLIVGAEPHLQPASLAPAPPPEPSQSGLTGAAASFYSGDFEATASSGTQPNPSMHTSGLSRPSGSHHSSSAPTIPTLGGAGVGAAAGYMMSGGMPTHQQTAEQGSAISGDASSILASTNQTLSSHEQDSYHTSSARPPKPGKFSSQSSDVPLYAAGAAAATGLAAVAYSHNHHQAFQHSPTAQHHSATPTRHRHRHNGPLSALVDFFKDPEGVALYEEYTEFTGVCRGCFEPGSSPRDAPRKHRFYKKRSKERLGATTRIDKPYRYSSSDDESRRKKNVSWIGAGLAGYGLGKVGEALFNQRNDFDYTNEVKSGLVSTTETIEVARKSSERRPRRRSGSNDRAETVVRHQGKIYRKRSHDGFIIEPDTTTYPLRRRSTSRSRSRDHKGDLAGVAVGATVGSSIAVSAHRQWSHSPRQGSKNSGRNSRDESLVRRRNHKRNTEKGFFSFLSPSSSSSSLDLNIRSHRKKQRQRRNSSDKIKNNREAEAALLGLGAATAVLALKDGRSKRKTGKEMTPAKERTDKPRRHSNQDRSKHSSSSSGENWESASEGGLSNVDSDLAFGSPSRRSSRESLASQSSGTNKWDWRWGSRNKRPESAKSRDSKGSKFPIASSDGATILDVHPMMPPDHYNAPVIDSTGNVPLQYVYPVQTSDPGRFDVQREGPATSAVQPVVISRPEAVRIEQPQPIVPVSSSFYSSQAPVPRPSDAPTFSQPSYLPQSDNFRKASITSLSHTSPRHVGTDETSNGVKLQRRGTSPARLGEDTVSNSAISQRSHSAKDDNITVRFAISEEEEDKERKERQRGKKEENLVESHKEYRRRGSEDKPARKRDAAGDSEKKDAIDSTSWIASAVGAAGGAMGAALIADKSSKDETREERRERRRRERELEDEQDALARSERRRRKERERQGEGFSPRERRRDGPEEEAIEGRRQEPEDDNPIQRKSVWQEAGTPKHTTHEDYQSFFTPIEVLNKNNDQAKVTSADPDADFNFVEIKPKLRRPDEPEFSIADTDDKIDLSGLSLAWPVPHLRLVQPTPPVSRVSTPFFEPVESDQKGAEDVKNDRSLSKVAWGDDRTHEYTDIPSSEHPENPIEPSPEEVRRQSLARDFSDSESEDQMFSAVIKEIKPAPNESRSNESYGNDYEFAATLAASAQDAGFDPSIVIDDPTYRRRDSPPGSSGRALPGLFDEDEEQPLRSKVKKKKRDKAGKSKQSSEPSEEPNDSAVVEDLVSQVGQSGTLDDANGDRESRSTELPGDPRESPGKAKYDHNAGGAREIEKNAHTELSREQVSQMAKRELGDNQEASQRSHEKLKRRASGLDGSASTASSVANGEIATDAKSKARKGSLWNRVLGKSTDDRPSPNEAQDQSNGRSVEDPDKLKQESNYVKGCESLPDVDVDVLHTESRLSKSSDMARERKVSGASEPQDTGRRTQDLLAKDDELPDAKPASETGAAPQPLKSASNEPERALDQPSESFLGMRPEPPRPPDIEAQREEPPGPIHLEDDTSSKRKERRPSEIPITGSQQSPRGAPSPTAVPVHFRRPRPISGSQRSVSQSSSSSTRYAPEVLSKPKPRPRSTEFKSSKEIRPLWLVERHQSHQEPSPNDTYPPLPDSQSTSAASSVYDPKEMRAEEVVEHEMAEQTYDTQDLAKAMYEGPHTDVLGSQQATPTAASFETQSNQMRSSPPSDREIPLSPTRNENTASLPSHTNDTVVDALVRGTTTFVLSKAVHHDDLIDEELPTEKADQFQTAEKEMAPFAYSMEPETSQAHTFPEAEALQSEKEGAMDYNTRPIQAEFPHLLQSIGEASVTLNNFKQGDRQSTTRNEPVSISLSKATPLDEVTHIMTIPSESQEDVSRLPAQMLSFDAVEPKISAPPVRSIESLDPLAAGGNIALTPVSEVPDVGRRAESSLAGKLFELSPLTMPLPEGDDSDLLESSCENNAFEIRISQKDHETSGDLDYHSGPTQGYSEAQCALEEVSKKTNVNDILNEVSGDDSPAFINEKKTRIDGKPAQNAEFETRAVLLTKDAMQTSSITETPRAESDRIQDADSDIAKGPPMETKDEWAVPSSRKKGKMSRKQKPMAIESDSEGTAPALTPGEAREHKGKTDREVALMSPDTQGSASLYSIMDDHETLPDNNVLRMAEASTLPVHDALLAAEERRKMLHNVLDAMDESRDDKVTDMKPADDDEPSLVEPKKKKKGKKSKKATALVFEESFENSNAKDPTTEPSKPDITGATDGAPPKSEPPSKGSSSSSTSNDRPGQEAEQYMPRDTHDMDHADNVRHGQAKELPATGDEMLSSSNDQFGEPLEVAEHLEGVAVEAISRALEPNEPGLAPRKYNEDNKKSKKAKSIKLEDQDALIPDTPVLSLTSTVSPVIPTTHTASSTSNFFEPQVTISKSSQSVELADDNLISSRSKVESASFLADPTEENKPSAFRGEIATTSSPATEGKLRAIQAIAKEPISTPNQIVEATEGDWTPMTSKKDKKKKRKTKISELDLEDNDKLTTPKDESPHLGIIEEAEIAGTDSNEPSVAKVVVTGVGVEDKVEHVPTKSRKEKKKKRRSNVLEVYPEDNKDEAKPTNHDYFTIDTARSATHADEGSPVDSLGMADRDASRGPEAGDGTSSAKSRKKKKGSTAKTFVFDEGIAPRTEPGSAENKREDPLNVETPLEVEASSKDAQVKPRSPNIHIDGLRGPEPAEVDFVAPKSKNGKEKAKMVKTDTFDNDEPAVSHTAPAQEVLLNAGRDVAPHDQDSNESKSLAEIQEPRQESDPVKEKSQLARTSNRKDEKKSKKSKFISRNEEESISNKKTTDSAQEGQDPMEALGKRNTEIRDVIEDSLEKKVIPQEQVEQGHRIALVDKDPEQTTSHESHIPTSPDNLHATVEAPRHMRGSKVLVEDIFVDPGLETSPQYVATTSEGRPELLRSAEESPPQHQDFEVKHRVEAGEDAILLNGWEENEMNIQKHNGAEPSDSENRSLLEELPTSTIAGRHEEHLFLNTPHIQDEDNILAIAESEGISEKPFLSNVDREVRSKGADRAGSQNLEGVDQGKTHVLEPYDSNNEMLLQTVGANDIELPKHLDHNPEIVEQDQQTPLNETASVKLHSESPQRDGNSQPINREDGESTKAQMELLTEGAAVSQVAEIGETKDVESTWYESAKKTKTSKKRSKSAKITSRQPEIIEEPQSQMAQQVETPPVDTPLSNGSIDLLDAEGQREYDEKYARELQRLLQSDTNDLAVNKQHNETMESTADTIAKPSAQESRETMVKATPLEAIVEEPCSRSGSVQNIVSSAENDFPPFKPTKKSKKGKKGKKEEQPIIWEDDTATPAVTQDVEPPFDESRPDAEPLHLEEHKESDRIRKTNFESPIIGSPSLRRMSTRGDDEGADYFGTEPLQRAEMNIGSNEGGDHGPLLSRELPDSSQDPVPKSSLLDCRSEYKEKQLPDDSGDTIPAKKSKKGKSKRKGFDQGVIDSVSKESGASQSHYQEPDDSSSCDVSSDSQTLSPQRQGTTDANDINTATALGPAAVAAKDLTRRMPKEGKKRDEKHNKTATLAEVEELSFEVSEEPVQQVFPLQEPSHENEPRSEDGQSVSARHQSRSRSHVGQSDSRDNRDDIQNRNSAVHFSDSPVFPEVVPGHRVGRDSGYPDSEVVPLADERGSRDEESKEHNITDSYVDEPKRESGLKGREIIEPYRDATQDRRTLPSREQANNSQDRSRAPLQLSTDMDHEHRVSTPEQTSKRRRPRRGSGAAYDSDDSADSGFDIQRRRRRLQTLAEEQREPSPVSSTTKDRSSALFDSSPSGRDDLIEQPRDLYKTGSLSIPEAIVHQQLPQEQEKVHSEPSWSFANVEEEKTELPRSLFGGPSHKQDPSSGSRSPPSNDNRGRQVLRNTPKRSVERLPQSPPHRIDTHQSSRVGIPEQGAKARTMLDDGEAGVLTGVERSVSRHSDRVPRRQSNGSAVPSVPRDLRSPIIGSSDSVHAIIRTPDQVRSASGQSFRSSGTPPLRRVDRSASGDLRAASRKTKGEAKIGAKPKISEEAEPPNEAESESEPDPDLPFATSSSYDPLTDKGKSRADPDMADYEGWGDVRGQSPMSPTRPPSMRKRQSMHFAEMEQRLAMLVSENSLLQGAKSKAEKRLEEQARDHSQQRQNYDDAIRDHKAYISERDSTLNELNNILDGLRQQVAHLTEANEELMQSQDINGEGVRHDSEQTSRELDELRIRHTQLSTDHEDIVSREVEAIRADKDIEIQQLRDDLENAKEQVRKLQQQILASRSTEDIVDRDEDYFDAQCQELCTHLTSWVTRFSKLSDNKRCYLAAEIRNEAHRDLYEDSMLDGSEVDDYLQDRHKRRDIFMSVTMSLIFKHVFARYLFGMDREHRQKLKTLDKTLQEVGPPSAVHKWRATTLTLLSKRPAFQSQRDTDSEAVVNDICTTLSSALPPPSTSAQTAQCRESLRRIVNLAVDLSIDMRLQRAEYSMLPPPEPDFDPQTGDIKNRLYFTAASMNERSGGATSNEELEDQGAWLRMVLFPLVVKNTDEEDQSQIVVFPASVHVAPMKKGKTVRVMSAQGERSEARQDTGIEDTVIEGGMF